MPQSGYTPIQLYYSTTASATPSAGNLANGELAINITDKKLYAKDNTGTVFLLASEAGTVGTVSSVAMSVPSFLSVTGSPVTTSGTLAVSLSGTALPNTSGGTGSTSAFNQYGVTYASTSTTLATTSSGTSGQVLTSNGTSAPTWQTPAPAGISTGKSIAMAMIFGF